MMMRISLLEFTPLEFETDDENIIRNIEVHQNLLRWSLKPITNRGGGGSSKLEFTPLEFETPQALK